MLDEAHRSGEVVHKPRQPAVVEIDHAQRLTVDQQIRQPQIGMHQPKARGAVAVDRELGRDHGQRLLDYRLAGGVQSEAGAPRSPVALRAHHGVEIPALTHKTGRFGPAPRVRVHAGVEAAELAKPVGKVVGLRGFFAAQKLKGHGFACGKSGGRRQGLHALPVYPRHRRRGGDDAVGAECVNPRQLRLDFGHRGIAQPMQAQHEIGAGAGVLQAKSGVLRQIQQRDGGLRGESPARQTRTHHCLQIGHDLGAVLSRHYLASPGR